MSRASHDSNLISVAAARSPKPGWIRAILILLTLIAFAPVLTAQFTNWDDNETISKNPRLNPPTFSTLIYYWSHPYMDLYVPVTQTVWTALAWAASPLAKSGVPNPVVFHGANLVLHAAAVLVVFEILRRLLRSNWPALAGAIVFALHPVQVEPVAWASGMKDVLSGLFSLIAIYKYTIAAAPFKLPHSNNELEFRARHQRNSYLIATVAFALAMLAKPSAITLPILVAVLDRLLLRRSWGAMLQWIMPWIILAIPIALVAHYAQPAILQDAPPPLYLRPLVAGHALAFYLMKIFVPIHLCPDYGWTPQIALRRWAWFTWIVPVIAGALLFRALSKSPKSRAVPARNSDTIPSPHSPGQIATTGALLFLAGLLPVLGFVPFDFEAFSVVADHYLYMPMLGVALCVAALIMKWDQHGGIYPKSIAIAGATVTIVLMTLSFFQATYWRDTNTLFNHVLAVNSDSWTAHNNLASAALDAGDAAGAEAEARRSLEINPAHVPSMMTLGAARARQGDLAGTLKYFELAVQIVPGNARLLGQVAGAEAQAGHLDLAERMSRRALEIDPHTSQARQNLATLLLQEGSDEHSAAKLQESVEQFRLLLEDDDREAQPHVLMGIALQSLGRDSEAAAQFKAALQIEPGNSTALMCLKQIQGPRQ
jgi:Flp pilus assembly protein TadD